jgi:hypothetical protein
MISFELKFYPFFGKLLLELHVRINFLIIYFMVLSHLILISSYKSFVIMVSIRVLLMVSPMKKSICKRYL